MPCGMFLPFGTDIKLLLKFQKPTGSTTSRETPAHEAMSQASLAVKVLRGETEAFSVELQQTEMNQNPAWTHVGTHTYGPGNQQIHFALFRNNYNFKNSDCISYEIAQSHLKRRLQKLAYVWVSPL